MLEEKHEKNLVELAEARGDLREVEVLAEELGDYKEKAARQLVTYDI